MTRKQPARKFTFPAGEISRSTQSRIAPKVLDDAPVPPKPPVPLIEDSRPLKTVVEDYDVKQFRSRDCQKLYETVRVHEVASDYCIFDFESLTSKECRIENRFREYVIAGWCSFKEEIFMELVREFYTNITSVTSDSQRQMLVFRVDGVDVLITEDPLTHLFGLSSTGHEC